MWLTAANGVLWSYIPKNSYLDANHLYRNEFEYEAAASYKWWKYGIDEICYHGQNNECVNSGYYTVI